MSANEPALLDPFAVSAPDEAAELSALVRTLELAEGFQLIFVRCNQIPQRERLMEEVRSRLPKLNIQAIFFREPTQHLLHSIQEQLTTPLPDAVFVSGLEFSLPVAAEAHAAPLIANINAARNSLVELLPCPLVIWVPEHVLSAIANGAPDFFSIRSSVYFFSAKPSEIISLGQNLSIGEFWQVESLSQNEKQERIIALERLLTDYELLPAKQRNHYTEVRLLEQLGALFHAQGETEKSLVYSGRALEIAEKLGDLAGVVTSLHNIGMVKQDQGNYGQALGYFQRALKISEELGRLSGVADALIEIGNVQYLSGNLLAAVEYFQRALKLNEDLGKQPGVASIILAMSIKRREISKQHLIVVNAHSRLTRKLGI
jgi:tetratricopeptide (TPR) repeat protein